MLSNKINHLKLFLWFHNKSIKNRLITDFIFVLFTVYVFVKELNSVFLILIYFFMYFLLHINMVDFSNAVLSCTPLKIRDIVNNNATILWFKATAITALSIIIFAIYKPNSLDFTHIVDLLKYVILSYVFFKNIFVTKYYIPQKYRNLIFYAILGILGAICFYIGMLSIWLNLCLSSVLIIILFMISNVLIKRLVYEKILLMEEI